MSASWLHCIDDNDSLGHLWPTPSFDTTVPQSHCPILFANAYYRLAGCKIGKNVNINTSTINDPSLVELGDNVVVGGGATINGHLVEKGNIVLEKVIVGKNSTVGGATMVGPGSRIGENCILGSRAVLPKRKVIPDGEVWAGIPARFIKHSQSDSSK